MEKIVWRCPLTGVCSLGHAHHTHTHTHTHTHWPTCQTPRQPSLSSSASPWRRETITKWQPQRQRCNTLARHKTRTFTHSLKRNRRLWKQCIFKLLTIVPLSKFRKRYVIIHVLLFNKEWTGRKIKKLINECFSNKFPNSWFLSFGTRHLKS